MRAAAKFVVLMLLLAPSFLLEARSYPIHAYRDYSQPRMQKMHVVGQIASRTQMTDSKHRRLLDYDNRPMIITARLYEHEGLRLGDTIFIIEKDPDHARFRNGLIVAEVEIFSIFKTEFQGWMLKARGNLSMVRKGHYVARVDTGSSRQDSWVAYKKGDRFKVLGDKSRAYKEYKRSLEADPNRPETYLRLAMLTRGQGQNQMAYNYLKSAWERLNKFEDVNDVLKMPGLFLKWHSEQVSSKIKTREKQLQEYLFLLAEMRRFQTQLRWFKHALKKDVLRMLEKKGLPKVEFQVQMGRLYQNIYEILNEKYSVDTIMHWLDKHQRKLLYEPIYLPYRQIKYTYPKKAWDEAFLEASLYHFQLAHTLNPLDTRAAYQIVMLSYGKYKSNPPRAKRETYYSLVVHFAKEYKRVPFNRARMSRIRSILRAIGAG